MQKGFGVVYILVGVLILSLVAGGAYYFGQQNSKLQPQNPPNNQQACTQEAKICPDGSAVGRVGPNCEFAECPADETVGWKTYTNTQLGYSLKYPQTWNAKVYPLKPYEDLVISSPDFQFSNEGIGVPIAGVQVSVRVQDATESDVEAEFSKDILGNQIAQNKRIIDINNIQALQYDYSYETTMATDTRFIKNRIYYLITFRYASLEEKAENIDLYEQILSSFTTQ